MINDSSNNNNAEQDEELSDEEIELILQAHNNDILNEDKLQKKPSKFPKLIIGLIAITMIVQSVAFALQTYSIPAIEFLKISRSLSQNEEIASYKKAVVTIVTDQSKGTGFAISSDGFIITNYHVIGESDSVKVVFENDGRFEATVINKDKSVDLALLKVDGDSLPHLKLAEKTSFGAEEHIYFIGNPLRFHGIANEGTIIDYTSLSSWNDQVVMIKAPVYRGNSGSPVINESGQVIGVIFATLKHEVHGKVGLFLPIDYFYKMTESGKGTNI